MFLKLCDTKAESKMLSTRAIWRKFPFSTNENWSIAISMSVNHA